MKVATITFWLIFGVILASVNGIHEQDRTITKVVKLLKKMLDKSREESEADRLLYAKYKCYVDKNKAEKEKSIKELTAQIELLSSEIAALQAENGELSTQVAALERDMTANKAAQDSATKIREASAEAFETMHGDLKQAIGQMQEAVDVLSSIGLSQQKANVHKKEAVLLSLSTKVRNDLKAVSALLSPENRQEFESLLQAPLANANKAKGDAIVDILKKLTSTFEDNLKHAEETEEAEKKAYDAAMETLKDSHDKLEGAKEKKEEKMGANDDSLGDKAGQLESAENQKKDDEEFLEKLMEDFAEKSKGYEERKMLRANEEAAISEAIAILNSDAAFDTFGDVKATSEGATSFLQLRRLRGASMLEQAETVLIRAATSGHSTRLARVATSIRAGHAFSAVMDEIEKIKKVIDEEGQADQENFDWCKEENERNEKDLDAKKTEIEGLKEDIDGLEKKIGIPEDKSGLIWSISEKEKAIVENQENQVEITVQRQKENVEYRKNVMNLVEAEDILGKAIKVLERYYKQLEKHMAEGQGELTLLQKEDPSPPELYGEFEGQKSEGNKVIEQLQFILGETKKEHEEADKTEEDAKKEFEEEMGDAEEGTGLKGAEKQMQEDLVKLKKDLAEARKELAQKKIDLKETTAAKVAIEKYMAKIKPGCDFIIENKDLRDQNRATEKAALEKAEGLIKDTPAYKKAVAKQEDKCKAQCKLDTTSLNCKACMSGTPKKEYCEKHPGTPGCK